MSPPPAAGLSRRRLLLALCALPIAPALAGCLIETTPRTPTPPTRTPTPRPTATATAQPVRFVQSTPGPPPSPTFAPPPAPAPSATPLSVSDPRGAGGLLYAGRAEGRGGVVALRAGGGAPRLLTEGSYERLLWAPDGGRFAAIGAIPGEAQRRQVAIFGFNGRTIARYPFEGASDRELLWSWSPDSQYLHYLAPLADDRATGAPVYASRVIGDEGAVDLPLPGQPLATPRWIAGNRLLVATLADGTLADPLAGANPVALWSLDAAGQGPRQIARGAFRPIGLSPDETTLYALADPELIDLGPPNARLEPTSLAALNLRTGQRRTLVRKAALVRERPGDRQYWLTGGSLSPDGARIVLALAEATPSGTPGTAAGVGGTALLVNSAGGAAAALPPGSVGLAPSWSPDGTKLASYRLATTPGENLLHILDLPRGEALSYPLDPAYQATLGRLAWSNDSRWLAYNGARGLAIVAAGGQAQTFPVAEEGRAPAWRPGGRA